MKDNEQKPTKHGADQQMTSQIARIAAGYVLALLLPVSLFLLFRGHNSPGGGFIAGLVAGSALFFYAVAHGPEKAEAKLRVRPEFLCASGLLLCLLSAGAGAVADGAILKGYWLTQGLTIPWKIKVGTPLLFDIGVYLTVAGSFLMIVMTLIEEYEWK